MIKSVNGRIYFGTALTFFTIPVIILLYFSAFRRHDALLVKSTQAERITELVSNLQLALVDIGGSGRSIAGVSGPDPLRIATIDRLLSDLDNALRTDQHKLTLLRQVEQTTSAYLAGDRTRIDGIRSNLIQIKQEIKQELLALQQQEADTDYWEECAMWVTVLVVVINVAILLVVIFEEFRKRRKAERELKANLETLQNYNQESAEQNWQLSGLSAISQCLQDQGSPQEMSRNILTTLTEHLDLPAGAIYLYNAENNRLEQVASIGFSAETINSFELGKGLVGQAARQPQIRLLNDIPATYWKLTAGSGEAQPVQLALVPLWHRKNKELAGILELASFRQLEPTALKLLNQLMEPLARAIDSAQTHERVRALLYQVQQQNELVAEQQEELRQSNESLLRQAESLQASEEELRVQEEELRQTNAELIEKNEAVEIARQSLALKARELEVTSQYKSAFLANMSHELRTPLNSVLILAKLLADNKPDNLTPKQIEYANIIHKSGNDLLTLINDILDLAKIEAGHITVVQEPVQVKRILRDLTQLFTVVADEKQVALVTHIAESVPANILTDPLRVEQILKNLLSNAFKFTPRNGRVTLGISMEKASPHLTRPNLKQEQSLLTIAVSDTGIGIPADKQKLIFDAFQQVDGSTSRKYGGTGLGLSISRELVKRLGGEITLRSEEGKGSTFTLWLPLSGIPTVLNPNDTTTTQVVEQIAALPVPSNQPAIEDDRHTMQKGDRVMLIIEDDATFARIVQDFARTKGYKTIIALQGDEGLAFARQYEPTAIILDLQLPALDGISILKLLKDDKKLRSIPVHVMSANTDYAPILPGALAYVQKPLTKQDLEDAFTRINHRITEQIKNVLVLSGNYLPDNSLTQLIDERHFDISCDYAVLNGESLKKVETKSYDCVIADIGTDLKQGIDQLRKLQAAMPNAQTPVIIYLDKELSSFDELQLKKLADTVVHDSVQAKDRLMDQLELFLFKVQQETIAHPLPAPASHTLFQTTSWEGKTVLLVDDDMRNVFSISTLLEENKLTVITASDGQEALDALTEHAQIDLVLMDIMMPIMDGYEATRKIRANKRFEKLPIVALTAKAMPGDREKCLEAGASDYITKPLDSNWLLSTLATWLPAQL